MFIRVCPSVHKEKGDWLGLIWFTGEERRGEALGLPGLGTPALCSPLSAKSGLVGGAGATPRLPYPPPPLRLGMVQDGNE